MLNWRVIHIGDDLYEYICKFNVLNDILKLENKIEKYSYRRVRTGDDSNEYVRQLYISI